MAGSGPPDKINEWIDLSSYSAGTAQANALSALYTNFYTTYGVYPTVAITVGTIVYVGGYGS